MKRFIWMMTVFTLLCMSGMSQEKQVQAGSLGVRGVWVSCFEFEKFGLKDKPEGVFRANADRIFANIKANGCNTVYFHVRAYDDAIYPSSVVGWSRYISGSGSALSYNPLSILVSSAHKHGLKFHAWMNPYRVTAKKVLDPGQNSTTDRIVRQVKEMIEHYPVDGIHFDDYFYPTNEKKYKKVDKATRMKNVNGMVQSVYHAVKQKNKRLLFGISPAGDINYCERIGADVKTWLSCRGYIDYIVPQIYWSDHYLLAGKKTKLFTTRLSAWRKINSIDIPMYVGLALYKTGYKLTEDPGWQKSSRNIARQITEISTGNTEGYVLFSYSDLYRASASKELKHYFESIGKIYMSKSRKTLKAGKKYRLRASISIGRLAGKLKWRSSNKKIATVTKTGLVKARKKGKVKIYASYGSLKRYGLIKVKKKK